ncbi:hypothetical protein JS533_012265 [Bifidobacterium amazonense]|uniref:Uncharacterized protein n=1 Tax=Bifidobacterium amazonense TaxID=2809027 RepID=A0ABS9VY77_9BIFI|nr:hypothetical protein [Bifidobacterium amazonense]MCH9277029.1 hypothetical protein [Bifidobacterium amazonense]
MRVAACCIDRAKAYGSLQEMAAASDAIVAGTIGDPRTVVSDIGWPTDVLDIKVKTVLKGDVGRGDTVTAVQGVADSDGLIVPQPGETVLMFLVTHGMDEDPGWQYFTVGVTAGVYVAGAQSDTWWTRLFGVDVNKAEFTHIVPNSIDDVPETLTLDDVRAVL